MNKLEKTSLAAGVFFGATGVILGAVGSYALKGHPAEALEFFRIGNKYQIYHALFLLILGLLQSRYPGKLINLSIFSTIGGTVLFSGSLYLLALANIKVGMITPIGGMLLISAWIMLLIHVLSTKSQPAHSPDKKRPCLPVGKPARPAGGEDFPRTEKRRGLSLISTIEMQTSLSSGFQFWNPLEREVVPKAVA